MIGAIFRASGLGKEASASLGLVCDSASPADVVGVFLKTNKTQILIYALLEEVPHLISCGYRTSEGQAGTWDQRFGPSGDRAILIADWSVGFSKVTRRFSASCLHFNGCQGLRLGAGTA
jgi:hypothetical protein